MKSLPEMLSGKNINFLIGSGASLPLYPTLSLGDDLPSFEDFVCSDKLSPSNKKLLYCYYYFKWVSPMKLSELRLQKTDLKYVKVTELYQTFVDLILGILECDSIEKPKRANIFTTNYDLLFEDTFDVISQKNPLCYFNDGSRGFITRTLDTDNFYLNLSHSGYHDTFRREVPTINLFKMHGSITWNRCNRQISVRYSSKLLTDLDKSINDITNFDVDEIDDIFDNLDNKEDFISLAETLEMDLNGLDIDTLQIDSFFEAYENLPIINPNKWKFHDTVFEQHYYQMIRSFSYEMEKENTVLVVFAFSFADEHLLDIFRRSLLNPLLQVMIVSFSENGQNELKRIFAGYKNITYYPVKFELDNGEIIFGDFDYFINLLRGQI